MCASQAQVIVRELADIIEFRDVKRPSLTNLGGDGISTILQTAGNDETMSPTATVDPQHNFLLRDLSLSAQRPIPSNGFWQCVVEVEP